MRRRARERTAIDRNEDVGVDRRAPKHRDLERKNAVFRFPYGGGHPVVACDLPTLNRHQPDSSPHREARSSCRSWNDPGCCEFTASTSSRSGLVPPAAGRQPRMGDRARSARQCRNPGEPSALWQADAEIQAVAGQVAARRPRLRPSAHGHRATRISTRLFC